MEGTPYAVISYNFIYIQYRFMSFAKHQQPIMSRFIFRYNTIVVIPVWPHCKLLCNNNIVIRFLSFSLFKNYIGFIFCSTFIILGLLAVPSSAVAQVCGGAVIKRFDIKLKGILKFALISSVLSLVLIPVYLARCSNLQIAGVFNSYPGWDLSKFFI